MNTITIHSPNKAFGTTCVTCNQSIAYATNRGLYALTNGSGSTTCYPVKVGA